MKNLFQFLLILSYFCSGQNISLQNECEKEIHFTVKINLKFQDSVSELTEDKESESIFFDQVILKLPKSYSPSGLPTRLVYCAHGAGGGVSSDSWYPGKFALDDSLLANGYAVFDVNGGPFVENMGGNRVVRSAYKAYCYIKENYNISEEIFVIGLSMGGLSSSNFVHRYSNIVLAHGLFSPVLDLYNQAWRNPWSQTAKKAIAYAFNFNDQSGETWEEEKVYGWNPVRIDTYTAGRDTLMEYPVPVKIWHGNADKIVRIQYSRNFHRYIQNAKGQSELMEIDGSDHGLSIGSPLINYELILFFRENDIGKK